MDSLARHAKNDAKGSFDACMGYSNLSYDIVKEGEIK